MCGSWWGVWGGVAGIAGSIHINSSVLLFFLVVLFILFLSLCFTIKHPRTTVWRHLHSAGFVMHNVRLAPHESSPSQKAERVGMAIELQQILQSAKHRTWRYFLTGDEP
jgi:hypothetical protein